MNAIETLILSIREAINGGGGLRKFPMQFVLIQTASRFKENKTRSKLT